MSSIRFPADLGPYADGSYTSQLGETVKLQPVLLGELEPELNSEKVVLGKVVCSINVEEAVCLYALLAVIIVSFTYCSLTTIFRVSDDVRGC